MQALHRNILLTILFITTTTLMFFLRLPSPSEPRRTAAEHNFRIALITKHAPFYERVNNGIESVRHTFDGISFDIDYFYAHGQDRLLSREIIEKALASKPDLLISVGVTLSQIAKNILEKRKSAVPMLFAGPGKPIEEGLVTNLEKPGGMVSGVALSPLDITMPARMLHFLKPQARKVLIPYNPVSANGSLEPIAKSIRNLLETFGMQAYLLPIHALGEVLPKISGLIKDVDTIYCLEGDITGEVDTALIKLCNQHGVTLFSADLSSSKKGAALCYGAYAEFIGEKVIDYAYQVLHNNIAPGKLPVHFITYSRKVAVNLDAAAQQGITLPEELLLCLSRGVVYKNGHEV